MLTRSPARRRSISPTLFDPAERMHPAVCLSKSWLWVQRAFAFSPKHYCCPLLCDIRTSCGAGLCQLFFGGSFLLEEESWERFCSCFVSFRERFGIVCSL